MSQPLSWGLNGRVQNNFSANTRWQARLAWSRDDLGGWEYRISGSVTARPAASIELSLAPSYSRSVTTRQYITQLAGGPAATYGTRYVFGTVGRSTISAQFRLSYAISPELTLEMYAEPFSASGQYYHIGELARPRTSDLRLYGTGGSTITRDSSKAFTVTDGADQFTLCAGLQRPFLPQQHGAALGMACRQHPVSGLAAEPFRLGGRAGPRRGGAVLPFVVRARGPTFSR